MTARIRVASYNLRGLKDDPAAAAEVVRRIDPDVLLLQEVPRHPLSRYRISDLARNTDLMWSGRSRRLSGTGMLTSMRVTSTDSVDHKLPVRLGANPRSYTVAQVRVPGGQDVTVVSVHLSLVADERAAHAAQVLDEVAAGPGFADGPLVVGGDLNESSDGRAWGLLAERLPWVTPERPTFPAAAPKSWIDAIFVSSDLVVAPHADVPLEPELVRAASDHLPVWVDLEVPEGVRV
jgi:endonuclease/exonuclease/phosphatase family metal-dependent hydrolase